MATVFRAYQSTVNRDVAIKVITKAIAHDQNAVQRFQREAQLIARLEHPHILPVYDFDGGHDSPYIVMRYLDGGTLKEVLQQGLLPPAEISYLMQQVCGALDYAHRQGIIHRDIKPSNIMIDREGHAFVTDFGLARMVGGERNGPQITATGAIMGTPDYMSPEQALGESELDQRTDIYALGVILYQMLTGELPFVAATAMGVLMMHIQEPIPTATRRNPSLPLAVDELIATALAKQPNERYPTAAAFAEAVMSVLGGMASSPLQLRQAAVDSVILRRLKLEAKDESDSKTPSEQNKTVTILYAGATEYAEIIGEEQGPEAARSAVKRLWDSAADLIDQHGGLVIARSDDTLLALWGVETTREDDAEQAIRAALDLQATLQAQVGDLLAEDDDEPLPLNIGLNTGMAFISPTSSSSSPASGGVEKGYTASGNAISLTNRLMQSAYGVIRITHEIYSQVRGIFEVEQDNPLKLRRGRGTIPTYLVLAAKPHAFRLPIRGVEGVETQLVGRGAELKTFQNAFLDAVEEKETQVITLVGEAGLGKSRLLYEFNNWVELRPEHFWVLHGRATPEMTHRPYALLRDMLSFAFNIRDSDSPATVRQKLEAGIAAQVGPDEEMAHLLGHLAGFDLSDSPHLEGMLGDPQQLTNWAKQIFKRWQAALSKVRPTVIELEDLHHADKPTLDLLNELISEARELPLLLIGLTRPALFERRPTWGSGLAFHTRVELHPLSRRESRSLAHEILQKVEKLPGALRDLLVERAEGNPYYLEELVKTLIDNRVIIKESDDRWRVESERLDHVQIPVTLVGLLQARLDSLLYPEKLTLQRAAVVGRIFYDSALATLDAADEAHLDNLPGILQRLVDQEFIYPRETTAFEGSKEYIFGDQMLREVLLTTLLRRQQETYYAAAAEWVVQISRERADEYAGLIADYYEKAGNYDQAAHYLQQAGEQALSISAFGDARSDFERVLNLLPKKDEGRLNLQLRLGDVLWHLGDYPAARVVLEDVLTIVRDQSNTPLLADALYWLSQVAVMEGNLSQAQSYLEESLPFTQNGGDEAALARTLYGLGDLYWRLGNYEAANVACEECLILARRIGDTTRELYAINRLATTMWLNDPEKAKRLYDEGLLLAEQVGNRERLGFLLNNRGEFAKEQGDFVLYQLYCQRALKIFREIGHQQATIYMLQNLADEAVRVNDVPGAQKYLYEGLIMGKRIGAKPFLLYLVGVMGWMLVEAGDSQQGLALMGLALYHSASIHDLQQSIHLKLAKMNPNPEDSTIATRLERGKDLDLDAVVEELLAELSEA